MTTQRAMNFLYVNNSGANLAPFHTEIALALRTSGQLPEALADLFTVTVSANPDGSPRFIIEAA